MSHTQKTDNLTTATIAKWLIPSVTALFVVAGYIAQTAQEELLGLGSTDADPNEYVSSAAEFLLGIVVILVDCLKRLISWQAVSLGGHIVGVTLASGATMGVMFVPRIASRWRFGRLVRDNQAKLLIALLVGLVGYKLLIFDVPLSQIANVIVDAGTTAGGESGATTLSFSQRLQSRAENGGDIDRRALTLWRDMVCSRIGASLGPAPVAMPDIHCPDSQGRSREELIGEFLALFWVTALVVIAAVTLLFLAKAARLNAAIAILALGYLLTLPYAYGKLIKPTDFNYGLVRIAQPLVDADSPASRKWPSSQPSNVARALDAHNQTSHEQSSNQPNGAIVVARGETFTNVLVATDERCFGTDKKHRAIRLSSLSSAQILSIEEIYRVDIIGWAALNESPCPQRCFGPTCGNS